MKTAIILIAISLLISSLALLILALSHHKNKAFSSHYLNDIPLDGTFMPLEKAVELVLHRVTEYAQSDLLSGPDRMKLRKAVAIVEDHFVNSVFEEN
jgi:hypothetical protein